jgi:tetratricopeptide (TPR) repeat protein
VHTATIFLIVLITSVLLYPLPIMLMKRKADRLATLGDYDGALRISRIWLRSKVYGLPFQGQIMLQAGRYSEALALLKDSAFDDKGRPLLKSLHLYFYAMTLTNEGKFPEAQSLLEAAVLVPQKMEDYFRFTLAECLLSQHKEANRALELVEQAMANLKRKSQSKQDRIFLAHCSAVDAWALASCGRREEAEARLEDAFAESNSLGKDDLAGLLQLKGETWLALGDSEMAQASFQQALGLFPYGSIGMLARRKLARLGETVRE